MNVKSRLLATAAILPLLAGIYFFAQPTDETSPATDAAQGTAMGIGTPDDPYARNTYEHDRLVDPSTGEIPQGIRAKELSFAKTLPVKDETKSLSWVQRGPVNKGGRTRALALDVLNENIMIAGGVSGGVWRSTDQGSSWISTTDPAQMQSVTTVVQDIRTGSENVWYYGTGEHYGIVSATSFTARYSGDGIFKSTDSGLSWTQLASTASGSPETLYDNGDFDFVWRIVTDHTDAANDVVLAAVYNGVFRSADGGTTWTAVLGLDTLQSAASNFSDVLIAPVSGIMYAALSSEGADKGFYRSADGGVTWTNIIGASNPTSYRRTVMAIDPSDENDVYFLSEAPGYSATNHSLFKYTYVSGDGSGAGGTWSDRSANLPNEDCFGYFTFNFAPFNSQSSFDLCIAVHPTDTNTLFIGGTNIYRSTDGFSSYNNWDWIGGYKCDTIDPSNYVEPGHHPDNHHLLFSPSDPNLLYNASDGGVARTLDCSAPDPVWESLNNGYYTTQFYTIAMEPGQTNNEIIIGGMQDNGTWFTNSLEVDTQWREVGIDDGAYCAISEGRDFYLISSQLGRIYKKDISDNGVLSNTQRIDPTGGPSSYNFINPFILDPHNTNILYIAARNRIWRNDDVGGIPMTGDLYNTVSTNWTNITTSQLGIQDGLVTTLDISEALPNVVFIGTSNSHVFRLDSANSPAATKTDISSDDFPSGSYISCIAPNAHDGDEWMATFSNYGVQSIFITQDGGTTWGHVGGNLEENIDGTGSGPAVFWASIYPSHPTQTYFVGTSIGLFSTTELDGDNTVWELEGASTLGNTVINMMRTRAFDGRVIVGTHGHGVYSSAFPPAFVGLETVPENDILVQHYPNPFSEQVTIEYMVKESSTVDLEILDASGRQVAILQQGTQQAGQQKMRWTPTKKTPAGMYIYRIRIGTEETTGQLMLTR